MHPLTSNSGSGNQMEHPSEQDLAALREEIDRYDWYHSIDLGNNVVTPGRDYFDLWNMIRKTREHIDYSEKSVLDIASFDGMWAFEAESLGANKVVATDTHDPSLEKFLLCKRILKSKVIPFYNVSVYNLRDRLQNFISQAHHPEKPIGECLFDIVQNLGLLYHVRDPMYVLAQTRSVIKTGGFLLLESAILFNEDSSFLLYNGEPQHKRGRVYPDTSIWWAPTIPCLKEMLRTNLFEPNDGTIETMEQLENEGRMMGRISLVAEAVEPVDFEFLCSMYNPDHNPGLNIEHIKPGVHEKDT